MADIEPWQPGESSRRVIGELIAGRSVAVPTESTYALVASALEPHAFSGWPANLTQAVVVHDYAELWDWLPNLRGAGARLFRKLGAGAVVLRADAGFRSGLWSRLPADTRNRVASHGLLAVRWPGHPLWNELRSAGMPLVAAAVPSGVDAQSVSVAIGDKIKCIIDAGPAPTADAPTVVCIRDNRCEVELVGALSRERIDEVSACRTLFICTGNTCRSPMAAAICAKLVADQRGCTPSQLKSRGFFVQSAGLAAMMGAPASADAVTIAADLGADLSQHQSQMVSMEMLLWADYIFGMTAGHCYTLESILPDRLAPVRLLSPSFEDIADPIGGELADYRTCAAQILECLQARLPELLES